jgi:hypothetical protein
VSGPLRAGRTRGPDLIALDHGKILALVFAREILVELYSYTEA